MLKCILWELALVFRLGGNKHSFQRTHNSPWGSTKWYYTSKKSSGLVVNGLKPAMRDQILHKTFPFRNINESTNFQSFVARVWPKEITCTPQSVEWRGKCDLYPNEGTAATTNGRWAQQPLLPEVQSETLSKCQRRRGRRGRRKPPKAKSIEHFVQANSLIHTLSIHFPQV